MKKMTFIGLVAVFIALTVFSCQKGEKVNPQANTQTTKTVVFDECEPEVVNLIAGQHINVGTVEVTNNANTVSITYTTTGDWMISEAHLYAGTQEGLPVNKKGNPQVGHFPIQGTFNPMVQTITYEVPLSELDACFIIAAHAVVVKVVDGHIVDRQTAWGEGLPMVDKGNWAMYFNYCECIE